MIDLLQATQNINKYKYDYCGYLVIVDQIRTKEVLYLWLVVIIFKLSIIAYDLFYGLLE